MSGTGDLISRIYGNFRGVDFRGEDVNLSRSPDAVNMWKDYRTLDSIRTRPALANVAMHRVPISEEEPLYGVHWYIAMYDTYAGQGPALYVHYGTHLVSFGLDNDGYLGVMMREDVVMEPSPSVSYIYDGKLYILNGDKYFCLESTAHDFKEIEPYIPTTTIGRKPAGGGTVHEDVNMLTTRRKNTFVGDGVSTEYFVDGYLRTWDKIIVKVNGKVLPDDEWSYFISAKDERQRGVSFVTPPPAPDTDGQDNVEIEFNEGSANWSMNKSMITGCTKSQIFDNRVFVYGNPSFPNMMWHCALNNPTYFSDLDYYADGQDEVKISALVPGNNALWVFREPSATNANVFYHTPTIDEEYGKIYPSTHSNAAIGCIGGAINFNDTIVYFSNRGMEGIYGDITTEQSIAHKSTMVDRKLLSEENYKNMILAESEGYLFVIIDNKIYLADSRATFNNTDHWEYEWFYWELPHKVIHASTYDGRLFLLYDYGEFVCLDLTYESRDSAKDLEHGWITSKDIHSHWVTPKDKFGAPHLLKTTNKRGCVVEAVGDITVSAKVEDTDFEQIGEYKDVKDYFVSRIKRKKWKDIQLKFSSETRFSLETATLEAFLGGYIKR